MSEKTYNGFPTLREALDAHKDWIEGKGGKRLDLSGADLSGAYLLGANLSRANLSGANLSGTNLSGANLSRANLSGANLSGANLSRANLSGANLSGADLLGANLSRANLSGANLSGADLSGTNLSGANLSRANLSRAIKWERYLSEVVPALCTAGGRTLAEVAAAWDCHSWQNCPMAVAFGVNSLSDIPPLYQREAELFMSLFDAKAIPKPIDDAESMVTK